MHAVTLQLSYDHAHEICARDDVTLHSEPTEQVEERVQRSTLLDDCFRVECHYQVIQPGDLQRLAEKEAAVDQEKNADCESHRPVTQAAAIDCTD